MAMLAAPGKLAYIALLDSKTDGPHDAMGVVDLDPVSKTYGTLISRVERDAAVELLINPLHAEVPS
jgi:hypothetical protein